MVMIVRWDGAAGMRQENQRSYISMKKISWTEEDEKCVSFSFFLFLLANMYVCCNITYNLLCGYLYYLPLVDLFSDSVKCSNTS